MTIKSVCGIQCEVSRHGSMNETRGILFVHEFNIEDGDILRDGLASYGVSKVEPASWIKPKRENTKAFLLSFNSDSISEYVRIPGEAQSSKIYEYKKRPMQCRKCQQYGHTIKRYQADRTVCGKCASVGHFSGDCTSETDKMLPLC